MIVHLDWENRLARVGIEVFEANSLIQGGSVVHVGLRAGPTLRGQIQPDLLLSSGPAPDRPTDGVTQMLENHGCVCLICRVERELILILNQQASQARFRKLATDFPALNAFTSPLELVTHLHGRAPSTNRARTPDETLGVLIRANSVDAVRDVPQGLLVLAFVPAIHRTYREISVGFPSLLREDVAQQVLTVFLEVASSNAIERRNSHLPLTIARTLRTLAFRWAIKEARKSADSEPIDRLVPKISEPAADANFEKSLVLQEFLLQCCRSGALSSQEYELLCKLKLEGFEAKEVAGLVGGLSTAAVHRRLQRIMRRLREAALLNMSQ